MSGQLRGESPW